MSLLYDMIYGVGGLVSSPVWGWRLLRTGKWKTDWSGRFGRGAELPHDRPTLLIHAVSVGEASAIRQLVELLETRWPAWRIVISVTTDTGLARAQRLYGERHEVVRYPLDFTPAVRRMLDRVRPSLVALTELEVWPNFVAECERREVPVCVINGRLSERSFKRYRLLAPLLRPTFAKLAAAAVQSADYAGRFEAMGVPGERTHVLDTMKWDTAKLADEVPGAAELAAAMGIDREKPLIVAGSAGPGEEKLLIEQRPKEAQLLLVPRKPERFEEVSQLVPGVVRRSGQPDGSEPPEGAGPVFLLDTMGELGKAYSLADVAVVGRSFDGLGGSDPIEPIALGRPTIIGPDHQNFADVVAAFEAGGGIVVADEPGPAVRELLEDRERARGLAEAGRGVIRQRQGATERHAELLERLAGEVAE
ncbi:MAG: 3-deoxy-D-manno-octulosonic acid transferase [Phycisphaeraceae bacterium]